MAKGLNSFPKLVAAVSTLRPRGSSRAVSHPTLGENKHGPLWLPAPMSGPCSAAQLLRPRLQGGQFNPSKASGCLPYPLTTGSRNRQGCLGLSSSQALGGLLLPPGQSPQVSGFRPDRRDPAPCPLEGEPKRLALALLASSISSPLAMPCSTTIRPYHIGLPQHALLPL